MRGAELLLSSFLKGDIMINVKEYSFYSIDSNYLKYLYSVDREVYYDPKYKIYTKPYVGIITGIKNHKYFIPLTSAKPKHKKWKNVSNEHFLIYEIIKKDINDITVNNDIYKKGQKEGESLHVLSVLDIKKMIPLAENCYKKIDIENLEDEKFQLLLKRELAFCKEHKNKILKRVKKFYNMQMESKTISFASCNFKLLEKAMKEYKKEKEPAFEVEF